MPTLRPVALLGCLLGCWSCDGSSSETERDAATLGEDGGDHSEDASRSDAARGDASVDADADGSPSGDAGAGPQDASTDAGTGPGDHDGGADAGSDAGPSAEGFFIAVSGGAKIARSDDGSSWSVVSDTFDGAAGWDGFDTENLFRAACAARLPSGQPLVLAVGGGTASSAAGSAVSDFPGRIARSSDGKSWTHTNSLDGAAPAVLLPTNWLGGCGFGNGRVVVVGAYFSLTSTDGVNWAKHSISLPNGVDFNARNMTFGAGVFVAVGEPGIYASNDGVAWDRVSITHANRVFFHGGVFIAPFENEAQYQRSTNGRDWTTHTAPATINRVAHDGQRFIASSRDGALLTSDDGAQFARRSNRDDQGLMGIAFGKGTYVSLSGMTSALYFRGDVTLPPLAWQSATIPGDAEGLHDLSVLFASFD